MSQTLFRRAVASLDSFTKFESTVISDVQEKQETREHLIAKDSHFQVCKREQHDHPALVASVLRAVKYVDQTK